MIDNAYMSHDILTKTMYDSNHFTINQNEIKFAHWKNKTNRKL